MQYYDDLINELSDICGIEPEYWDIFGKKHTTSIDTKKAVLRAMKLNIETAEDIANEISKRRWKLWKGFIEPVHVISVNAPAVLIPVYIPVNEGEESRLTISCSLEDESIQTILQKHKIPGKDITVSEQQWIDGKRHIKVFLHIEQRAIGYYVLRAECKHPDKIFPEKSNKLQKSSRIIITPDACYLPPELQKNPPLPPFSKGGEGGFNGKAWGLSINLYAIRSDRNWGIGDFTDLKKITAWVAGLKGSLVGINPLHVIPNTSPFGASPYSPISRLYKNFIYLDIERIPEVKESKDAGKFMSSRKYSQKLDELKKADLIDYEAVASLKEKILKCAFSVFYKKHYLRNTGRGREFRKYISEEGLALESFSLFMALSEHMKKTKNAHSWQEWPRKYHDMSGKTVDAFRKEFKKEIIFYQYVQWLIDKQIREISEEAERHGLNAGLYYDLAIGSLSGGSDAWTYQDVIADRADAGAPPDDFSPDGQKWGFPPLIPEKLKDNAYELFIQTMRRSMKYGRAIRIDHALGLFRLFWIPHDMTPEHGAYVACSSDDLLRIIALESTLNQTMVIAEDLGTIGEHVRDNLKRFQMLSCRLFYFERNYPDPSFLSPEKYPHTALCAVTTHDLPTLYGYWKGRDIETRRSVGKYLNEAQCEQQVQDRERDKRLILTALKSQGIIAADFPSDPDMIPEMTAELCLAIYKYLALSPCKLLLVSLDDIIGTLDQQNMPGTVDSYPNWLQKSPVTLEEIMAGQRFTDLAEMLKKYF
ncbi:MAG: 4-alpha-glucanotransferase [Nitrospira sp.]|nr:4-alpha-glucanotransferase [Nitrospira sp.]